MKKKFFISFLCALTFAVLFGCVQSSQGEISDTSSSAESKNESQEESRLQETPSADNSEESLPADISQNVSEEAEGSLDTESVPAEVSNETSKEEISKDDVSKEVSEEASEEVSEEVSEIPPEVSEEVFTDAGDAEFIPSGYLLYNGAAYSQAYFNKSVSQKYADAYAEYVRAFPGVRITAINPPVSSINIKNPFVQAMINDQGKVLDDIASVMYSSVNYINLRSTFEAHRGEYLFFKSDFHWTQLAAYYAYCEYAKSIGLTPTPLSAFEDRVLTTTFIGLTNIYAQDDRVNTFYDTLHAFMPRKEHTYTVYYDAQKNIKGQYDTCVHTYIETYSCFLIGDQPYAELVVPENDQSKVALVIKESSGNAFVPFLMEHYGKIIVIDPRHINIDIRPLVKNEGVDDIILFATASTVGNMTYCNYYLRLIGK